MTAHDAVLPSSSAGKSMAARSLSPVLAVTKNAAGRSKLGRPVVLVTLAAVALVAFVFALPTPEAVSGEAVTAATAAGPELPSDRFVVRDVRLFDGEKVVEGATVVVEAGRIARVDGDAANLTGGLPVVDGSGRTLLPGLIDAHTHSWGDALDRAIVFGVTTQLDQFGDVAIAAQMASEQSGDSPPMRADLLSAGTLITRAGGHGTQFGMAIPTLEPGADADAFVAARLAEGSAWIKIVIEDGHEVGLPKLLPTLDAAAVRAVVEAAHRRGVLAVAHVHALEAAVMAVDAGVDGLVHTVVDELPDPAFAAQLAARKVFVVATLSVLGGRNAAGARPAGSGPALAVDPRLAPYLRRGELAQLGIPGVTSAAHDGGAAMSSLARASIAVWRSAGVLVLAGTDAANPGTTWGASQHGELELLVGAGMSPVEALAAGTGWVADAFRLTDRGRIVAGRRADLLLVDGDPTTDITATRAIVAVWKAGRLVPRPRADASSHPKLDQNVGLLADFEAAPDVAPSPAAEAKSPGSAANVPTLPAGWQTTTDAMMGGQSVVELVVVADSGAGADGASPTSSPDPSVASNHFLRVRGELRPGFPFPWAGAMLALGSQPMAPVHLGKRTELRLRTRGGAVNLMVLAEGLARPLSHPLPAAPGWTEHRVDLLAIGVPADAVQAILICGGGELGPFEIDVDEVGLWPPAAVAR